MCNGWIDTTSIPNNCDNEAIRINGEKSGKYREAIERVLLACHYPSYPSETD